MRAHHLAAMLLFGLLVEVSAVGAQTSDGLNIVIFTNRVASDGGERSRRRATVDATTVGRTASFTNVEYRTNGCASGIGSTADMGNRGLAQSEGPGGKLVPVPIDGAWKVDVTPIRVSDGAATFKVKWVRSRDRQQLSTSPGAELELTLRPGESLPLDTVSNPPPPNSSEPCVWSLRIGVEHSPEPDAERRLLAVDLWLVERLPDGTERSQPHALRGIPNNGMPFYFDRITEGAVSFDLFGDLTVAGGTGPKSVTITLKNRVNPPVPQGISAQPADYYYIDLKRVTATLTPGEVVSVALPPLDRDWGVPDPMRRLSLRVRVRQLR